MDKNYNRLKELVALYKDEMVLELKGLVEIPSVTDRREEVGKSLDYALDLGERLGFKSRKELNGEVGVIDTGEGEETLGILVHVDVVNEGDMDKWETDPFSLVIKDDNLYARGTLDDKGPVISSLYALKAASKLSEELNIPFGKKVQMIIGTREETEWSDIYEYVESFSLPDYGFTPDGEFPICNIEKGVASVKLRLPFGTDERISRLSAGSASNVVPGKSVVIVDGKEIVIQGKSVHASQPEKGENAIMKMAEELISLDIKGSPLLSVAKLLKEYFEDGEGSGLGLRSESEYYEGEFVHRNIFTPTVIEADKESTLITFDIRYAYGTEFKLILEAFENLAQSYGGKVEAYQDLPPVYVKSSKPFLKAFADAYERMSGLKNEFVLAYGGSYAKAMPNIVSWGPIFPGDPDTCHEENEFISMETLVKMTEIFAAAIWDIVTGSDSYK